MHSSPVVRITVRFLSPLCLAGALAWPAHSQTASGVLTVQVGSGSTPPSALVSHANPWSYRRGTNEPQANWSTVAGSTTTNRVILPVDAANGSVFFRMVYP